MHKNLVMTSVESPCQYCKDRHVGCHGTCEKYQNYRKEVENANRMRIEHRIIESYGVHKKRK